MNEKILVPVLGESITEATVAKWLKNVGDTVEADEAVVELETDKVNLEVPSPISGTVGDIKFKDGDVVKVGTVLGSIQGNGKNTQTEIKKIEPDIKINDSVNLEKEKKDEEPLVPAVDEEPLVLSTDDEPLVLTEEIEDKKDTKKPIKSSTLSPSVRKIVAEKNIDVKSVKGTGKDGRILQKVLRVPLIGLINVFGLVEVGVRKILLSLNDMLRAVGPKGNVYKAIKGTEFVEIVEDNRTNG